MGTTRRLAQFVVRHRFSDLPEEIVEAAKRTIADALGCCIAGFTAAKEECGWILGLVKEMGGRPEATVFVDGFRTSAPMASLANGTMIHTVDFDDTHLGSISHLSASLVPTVFSLSERVRATGPDLLEAFVLGFEVGARVGRHMMPSHYKYWHPTSTFGSLASAAAASKLLGLNEEETEQALGLAADQAAGLRYCVDKGDYSKSLHPGFAAMKGVMFALLVQKGADGPVGLLEYPTGFCRALSENPAFEKMTEGLGAPYEIAVNGLKAYPTILCSHSSIQAVQELLAANPVEPEDIARIHLRISETAKGQGKNYEPTTKLAARLSIPFCVALAAIDRRVSLDQFTEERLRDPAVAAFMRKIEVEDDASLNAQYPETLASMVMVETRGGKVLRRDVIYPKGNAKNPLSREDVSQKFLQLASITLPREQGEELLSAILRMEELAAVDRLVEVMRPA